METLSHEAGLLVPELRLLSLQGDGRAQREALSARLDSAGNGFLLCGVIFPGLPLIDLLLVPKAPVDQGLYSENSTGLQAQEGIPGRHGDK